MQRSTILAVAVLAFAAFTLQASAHSGATSGRFDIVKTSNGTVSVSDLKGKGPAVDAFVNVTLKDFSTDFASVQLAADKLSFTVTYTCTKGRHLLTSGCLRAPVYVNYYATANGTTVRGTVLVLYWPGKGIKRAAQTTTYWLDFTAKVSKTLDFANSTTATITVGDINNGTVKNSKFTTRTFVKTPAAALATITSVNAVHDWVVDAELVGPAPATAFTVDIQAPFWTVFSTPITVKGTNVNGTAVDGLVWVTVKRPWGKPTKPTKPGKP